ncbi:ABC transporter permease [Paenibacillus naphthalenovorans]|uniref:ABC transporter permease n=1 Tax=Paenibacillus naphthalenovorans TaxID=162209 RepID=UPI00088F6369|nr:sugar ABC transporter permease [Paenibacillus naphthalenovorans]GCL72816.1 sugar ABC transporter permease [Paenibacillus naphthalenovorans]SDI08442.1 ABC-type sugar transport system, permease component [Paenibacillus naphthalenovorans]
MKLESSTPSWFSPAIIHRLAGAALAAPAVGLVAVLFVYPFVLSVAASLRTDQGEWTTAHYREAFALYTGDLWYTLWVCAVSLLLLLLVSVLLGGVLRLHASPFIEFLFKIPLFVPFVVVGHAMRVFLAPHGTLNSMFMSLGLFNPDSLPSIAFNTAGLILALVWKNIGFSLLLVMGAFRAVNPSYLEAARNVGAGGLRLIKDILVPMSTGSIGVVAVLTFTSMMGSFSIPAMMGSGSGSQMLMIDLYYQMVYQHNNGVANALGVLSYLVSMGAAIYYVRRVAKV